MTMLQTAPSEPISTPSDFDEVLEVVGEQLGSLYADLLKEIYDREGATESLDELVTRSLTVAGNAAALEVSVGTEEKGERDATGTLFDDMLGAEDVEDDDDVLTAAAMGAKDHASRVNDLVTRASESDETKLAHADAEKLLIELAESLKSAVERSIQATTRRGPLGIVPAS